MRWRAKLSMIASVSTISKPSLSNDTPEAACDLRDMRHVGGAQDHAENQPFRYAVFGAFGRPAEPSAAEQPRIETDRVRPVERDLPLRRTMGGNRIGQRIHAGKECPARRAERFVGFEHHRELDQIVTAHPHQCPGARLRCDLARRGQRRRRARATRPKYNRGADRASVPYPRDERSRRAVPLLLHGRQVYAIPRKPAARAAIVSCRCPPERLPQNCGIKQPPA